VAFDEVLGERVRDLIGPRADISEKRMFGGLAFLVGGNLACGISGNDLMVRLAATDTENALAEPGVRIFDMTGRPMKGWLLVSGTVLTDDEQLGRWVDVGVGYAESLPVK
jgi:TfoX/Sxy family transcriptional regulator of competence genes